MKKTIFLIPLFICFFIASAQKKNRFRINGFAIDASVIPSKFNTKASSNLFNTTTKSETKLATDLLASVSLYYSPKINLLAIGGWQWHTIQSVTTPFAGKTVTNQSLKLGVGIEYTFWKKNKSALVTQGLYMFENLKNKKSHFQQQTTVNNQPVVTLVNYYPGAADTDGTRHAGELKLLYSYSLNQSTHIRIGCGLSFELTDQFSKKAVYQGPPDLDFRMLQNATFSYNRESYFFFQAGIVKNISRKKKK